MNSTSYDLRQQLLNENGWLFYDAAFKAWKFIFSNSTGSSALDIGCGGGIMMALTRVFKPDCKIQGIEGNDAGRQLWASRNLNVTIGNIFELPFEDNSFETVYSSHVLEHLESPKQLIKEMERVAISRVINIVPDGDVGVKNFGSPHLHIFNRKTFADLHSDMNMTLRAFSPIFDLHMNQLAIVYENI